MLCSGTPNASYTHQEDVALYLIEAIKRGNKLDKIIRKQYLANFKRFKTGEHFTKSCVGNKILKL